MKNKEIKTVGLFGTCRDTTFREEIMIPALELAGVNYFNPQVEDWTPECAKIEAIHLANDEIICLPVTGESYGIASLAEIGFSIISASKRGAEVILMIDVDLDESLLSNVIAKDVKNARQIVLAHIRELALPNVHLVSSIEEMTQLAIELAK